MIPCERVVADDGLICPVVTIEGDRFMLRLPTQKILDEQKDTHSLFCQRCLVGPEVPSLLFYSGTDEEALGRMVGSRMDSLKDDEEWETLYNTVGCAWRPCLVPLDRRNKPDRSFFRENPKGTTFTGGAFLIDGAGYGETDWVLRFIPQLKAEHTEAGLGDVPEAGLYGAAQPINWVCWDDCLIAESVVAMGTLELLNKHGLLPHLPEAET